MIAGIGRNAVGAALVLMGVACGGSAASNGTALVNSSTTSLAVDSTTTTTATSVAPATSAPSSTTTTTTTTTLPRTLDIDGSPLIEFSIEVDPHLADQLPESEFVAFVIATLSDDRSWTARGAGFRLVDEGGLFTMTVATPDRVDELCFPLETNGRFSCARNGWVAINSDRWFGAIDDWPADLETYRRYLVNHEVGHYLLGPNHASCPGPGQPAPVMMQQTKGLGGCEANGWVEP